MLTEIIKCHLANPSPAKAKSLINQRKSVAFVDNTAKCCY